MSLLPATSHANPSNPYWAVDGPGISTVSGGAGITVTNGNGPTATIDNNGVITITASGPGITASGTTAVSLTNKGVTSLVAGSGMVVGPSTGAVTVSNQSFTDIWALGNINLGTITNLNTPLTLATTSLAKPYEYVEGYGYLIQTGGLCNQAPTITIYLSSGSNPLPLDTTKAKGYVLVPQTPPGGITTLTGYYYDLSTIKHYDPAGFTSVTLTLTTTFGGLSWGFNPTNSTSAFSNSTNTDVVVTKGTGLVTGGAGFKFFTSV